MFVNELHHGGIRAILAYDNTVFDNMHLPTGISLDEVVDDIIFKYGDAPLFCPDPAVLKYYIERWSDHRLPLWERFIAAVNAQYNPIENYNRYELSETSLKYGHKITTDDDVTHGHKITTNDDLTHGHKITTDDDLKHGETITTDDDLTHGESIETNDDLTHGLTVENKIAADNSATYQPDNEGINSGTDERDTTEEHSGTDERDITEEHSGTDERDIEETHSGKDERDYDETHSGKDERDVTESHSGKDITGIDSHIHGNIGVTTNQAMLNAEIDLIPKLDIINYIADDWHSEFNLLVY